MSIVDAWNYLYSNNPKIQSFAVSEGSKIVWQTDNWNLVRDIEKIIEICNKGGSSVKISGVTYTTVHTSENSYYASSEGKGHFLMAQVEKQTDTWILAWATSDSIPDLAIIDLRYVAKKLVN